MRLLGDSVSVRELVLVYSLHGHLLLHIRHLRLLRVQELLLLVCLALASFVNSFQLRLAVSLVRSLWKLLVLEPALMQVTYPVWRLLEFPPLE